MGVVSSNFPLESKGLCFRLSESYDNTGLLIIDYTAHYNVTAILLRRFVSFFDHMLLLSHSGHIQACELGLNALFSHFMVDLS